jgi:hypothetical protein
LLAEVDTGLPGFCQVLTRWISRENIRLKFPKNQGTHPFLVDWPGGAAAPPFTCATIRKNPPLTRSREHIEEAQISFAFPTRAG